MRRAALGQYLIYKALLSLEYPENELYLAIGEIIYEDFFQKVAIKFILEQYEVSLLVVDMNKQEIVKWIS
nr:element excision factor XisH family protein [Nostoc sp. CreGUA01]